MKRSEMLDRIKNESGEWDFIIIGGGATGLGVAVDAASRGFKTLLLEKFDFAKGTSSRSTKLVHGGVRYLQQGNVALVLEALRERGLMKKNAPHLVYNQSFIIPNYDWWSGPFYGVGMRVYDMLAGKLGLGKSKNLSKEKTCEYLPTIETKGLRGGVIYYDGQFDDSRLAVNLAQTAAEQGGTLLNYMSVDGLMKSGETGMVNGLKATDTLSGEEYEIKGRAVINATGAFVDEILQMDDRSAKPIVHPSQGIHIIIDKKFHPGDAAIMVPQTEDGRVLFAVPWHDKVIIGTTDTSVDKPTVEPKPKEEEIEFLISHAAKYLDGDPTRDDVKSVFVGLRPLVKMGDNNKTAELSRDHTLLIGDSGLITITGGKWTTYRKMAEDVIDKAALVAGYEPGECVTKSLPIHGWMEGVDHSRPLYYYGADKEQVEQLCQEHPEWDKPLHDRFKYKKGEVIQAVRNEMAMTVEDVLSRRLRALLLDAEASIEMAPEVARLMAAELGKDENWQQEQVQAYTELARGHML